MFQWLMKPVPAYFFILLFHITKAQTLYFPPTTGDTWDTIHPVTIGWCPEKVDSLVQYVGSKDSRAFILLKDGKIVIEAYYQGFNKDSLWYWASAGKTLTAFMVGIAQQEGYLNITDKTSDYLGSGWTSLTPGQEDSITIRHQLTMTSGLNDINVNKDCTDPTCLTYLTSPGTRWSYHNAPYTLLDGVIENATGKNLSTYTYQKLTAKTGISGLYIPVSYNNVFFSNARSFARYGLLILNKGNWDGEQIMTDSVYFNQMVNTSQNLNESYGYLWWLNGKNSFMLPGLQFEFQGSYNPNAPADMFAGLGKNGQYLNVVPSQNLVFIRMGDSPNDDPVPVTMNDTIWQYINQLGECDTQTSVSDIFRSGADLYPNPAHSSFTLVNDEEMEVRVTLIGMDGKSYSLGTLNPNGSETIQTTGFPRGHYKLFISGAKKNHFLSLQILN